MPRHAVVMPRRTQEDRDNLNLGPKTDQPDGQMPNSAALIRLAFPRWTIFFVKWVGTLHHLLLER